MSEVLKILERSRSTINPGLERMKHAMDALGMNESTLPPSILIGGTNGKGSTSGMLWRLLSQSGIRCGLYTSPHVISFHERVQVSHRELDLAFLDKELEVLKTKLPSPLYESLTFFELTTLLALNVFQKMECQLIIMEVGLGGRWDATNALEPIASAIVSIDYDHQEWLGNTLQDIAGEKLGIARQGKPLFWGDLVHCEELEATLQAARNEVGFALYRANTEFALLSDGRTGVCKILGCDFEFTLPNWLEGRADILRSNYALAYSLYLWVLNHVMPASKMSYDVWPYSLLGRMQRMQVRGKTKTWDFYLDVCHNVASVRECVRSLQSAGILNSETKKLTGFVSILRDKELEPMIELLREILEPFMLFRIDHERSISRERVPSQHSDLALYDHFEDLWNDYADSVASPLLVCGSFYAVGKVIDYFKVYPKTFSGQCMLYASDPRDMHQ